MRTLIACFKLFCFAWLCLIIFISQGIAQFIFQKSQLYFFFPRIFHRLTCLIFGIKVIQQGTQATVDNVIFLGNHISYIDIPVLGGFIKGVFIAKADVRQWPVFGILARIAGTVFIDRNRGAAMQTIENINKALDKGHRLIIFPEGTSTNGVQVVPFKSSLFELFLNPNLKEKLIIQPFTISIVDVNGAPVQSIKDHDLYAWHGDMTLPPHLWSMAKSKGATVKVSYHPPLAAKDFDSRKDFASKTHEIVASRLEINAKAT